MRPEDCIPRTVRNDIVDERYGSGEKAEPVNDRDHKDKYSRFTFPVATSEGPEMVR